MSSLGTPRPAQWLPGKASASAGLRLKRHGPWADWAGFPTKSRRTPRFRRAWSPRCPQCVHTSPRRRLCIHEAPAVKIARPAAYPTSAVPPSRSRRRAGARRAMRLPRGRRVISRTRALRRVTASGRRPRRTSRRVKRQPRTVRSPGLPPALLAALTWSLSRVDRNRLRLPHPR
jgi:hypothetical protein